jgi:hypothetical protein
MTATPASVHAPPAAPAAAAGGGARQLERAGNSVASLLLYLPLLSTTLFAKLSVPPFAAQSLSIAYLFIFLAIGFGLALGCLQPDTRRLSFFLIFVGMIGALQVFRGEPFSPTSLLLLGTLHLGYVFHLSRGSDSTARALDFFLGLATVLALLGIGQYLLQFVVGARHAFPIENLVPQEFVVRGFNMQAPIAQGLETYRANGIFFAEPSFFSQFMAIAIIVELLTGNRLPRLALYTLALLLSYSGTGVVLLAVCGPQILMTRRRWGLLWLVLLGLALLLALGSYLEVDKLAGRIGEFGSVRSSGYARFLSGFHVFDQYLWSDPLKALFGYGAGQFPGYAARMTIPAAEMTLFKMVFEYGLIGAAAYFSFIFYCFYRSEAPVIVRVALAMSLLLNGPLVPFFHGLALSLLVWPAPAADGEVRPATRKPGLADGA